MNRVKINSKMAMLIAMFALALTFTACSGGGDDDGGGGNNNSTYMEDSAGEPLLMDYNIKLDGIKDANMSFSAFSSQPLMIYYISPHCPQCQRNYSGVQDLAKEYEQKGLASIAISVSNVGNRDILTFIEQQNASIPFFQDTEQGEFGKKYGDGYVPRLFLVSPSGKVFRYTDTADLKDIKADIERMLGI